MKPNTDTTVRIFNEFYNLDLVVDAYNYEIVYSFFKSYTADEQMARSFAENLFRIANLTQVPVQDLLQTFQGNDALNVSLTMAYYLNSISNRTVMFGVNNLNPPNQYAQRNVVQ